MRASLLLLLCIPVLFTMASDASARTVEKVKLEESVKVGDATLVLNGTHLYEATMFNVDVYLAALYVPEKTKKYRPIQACDAIPWSLDLHYLRDISTDQLGDGWDDALEDRADDDGDENKYKKDRARIVRMLTKVKKGDVHTFRFIPGQGYTVRHNGKLKGTFKSKGFCKFVTRGFVNPKDGDDMAKDLMKGR